MSDTRSIITALGDHTTEYATPSPTLTLTLMTTTLKAFTDAMDAASTGGEADTAMKNQKRAVLEQKLRDLAAYVQVTANNDLAVLELSGFHAQKVRQPVGPLPAPLNLRLRQGNVSGQLVGRADPVNNASAYEWRYGISATPASWQNGGITTAARNKFDGLTPGTIYTVEVRAVGAAGPSDWSDPATLMVI